MPNLMTIERFADIDLDDPFFDTLKADYPGFDKWFARKGAEGAYVTRDDDADRKINGFLYLKSENGLVDDVEPPMLPARRMKVGTFKIDSRGTKMGERFLKKIFDRAIADKVDEIYVTVFEKHEGLTRLFDRYGFIRVGTKPAAGAGDPESVMRRSLRQLSGNLESDYPLIRSRGVRKYLLSIQPKWHTRLFPDSILNNEDFDVVQDLSHTNSIHKVYISWAGIDVLRPGDLIVMYRMKDPDSTAPAEYTSVATSIVVVEEVRLHSSFANEAEFVGYCAPYSVFTRAELIGFYRTRKDSKTIKFTYNAALSKRIIRKRLIEEVGLDERARWTLLPITDRQFESIVNLGGVNENLIVD